MSLTRQIHTEGKYQPYQWNKTSEKLIEGMNPKLQAKMLAIQKRPPQPSYDSENDQEHSDKPISDTTEKKVSYCSAGFTFNDRSVNKTY